MLIQEQNIYGSINSDKVIDTYYITRDEFIFMYGCKPNSPAGIEIIIRGIDNSYQENDIYYIDKLEYMVTTKIDLSILKSRLMKKRNLVFMHFYK